MTHPEELLAEYVDGSLQQDERTAVDAHIAACERCRDEVASARRARTALSALPEADLPIAFWHIYDQLESLLGEPIDHYVYEEGSLRLEDVIDDVTAEDVKVYGMHVAISNEIGIDTADAMRLRVWIDLIAPGADLARSRSTRRRRP